MATLTLKMNLDNAAFEDDPVPEILRVLDNAARKIDVEYEPRGLNFVQPLYDINGNKVGSVVIKHRFP